MEIENSAEILELEDDDEYIYNSDNDDETEEEIDDEEEESEEEDTPVEIQIEDSLSLRAKLDILLHDVFISMYRFSSFVLDIFFGHEENSSIVL